MVKPYVLLLIAMLILLTGCSTWKNALVLTGSAQDAIHIAIHDFINTSPLVRADNVFTVSIYKYDDDHLAVNIFGQPNAVLVSTKDRISYSYKNFPTRYLETGGKLFYWNDSTDMVTPDLIRVLTKYQHIDTTIVNTYIPDRIIDHTRVAQHYYFCKNNLRIYKKVRTKVAIGHYSGPRVNCN